MENLNSHINKLREDFSKGTLSEHEVAKLPSVQFKNWLAQAVASNISEVQAMTLATVNAQNKPSSRIVYLREFAEDHYSFYSNYQSRKASDLALNPNASLTFFWKELERQVRIEGRVEKASAEQSDNYFNTRPFDSKIGAWASIQSSKLNSRKELDDKIAELKNRFTPQNIVRPEYWGGYVLVAEHYEFWQGRNSRLHDRIVYTKENHHWIISRLAP